MINIKNLSILGVGIVLAFVAYAFSGAGSRIEAQSESRVTVQNKKANAVPVDASDTKTANSNAPLTIGEKYHFQAFAVAKGDVDYIINGNYEVKQIKGNWIQVKLVNTQPQPLRWFNLDSIAMIDDEQK